MIELSSARQQLAMLKILLATCQTTLDTLTAADNPLDSEFVADLRLIISRTEAEMAVLADRLSSQ